MSDLLLRGGRLFDPASGIDAEGDLLIRDGEIAGVGGAQPRGGAEVVDVRGLWVLPGLMDLHVHLREPGQEEKETIATGTAAAAAGGFTIIVCEPNTLPPTDTPARVEAIETRAAGAPAAVWPKCCITREQEGREVTDFGLLRQSGAVAASDDGKSVWDEAVMREAFRLAKATDMPLTVHVDAVELVERDIRLCAESGWPVHFSHVSLEAEIELLAAAQARGLPVTG
jgi:dihydroorotase